jgi:hypothetical protein
LSFSLSNLQAGFTLLTLPILCSLRGIPLSGLPHYFMEGACCLFGTSPPCGGADCAGVPQLALLYVAFNLAFNISMLALLRTGARRSHQPLPACRVD